MSHLSDKELDRLSREAAEQNDVPQNTSGWDSLHLRLDKEMPLNQRRQRRSLLLLLSLLVLLTGSGLVYQFATAPAPVAQQQDGALAKDAVTADRKQPAVSEKTPAGHLPENNATGQNAAKKQPTSPAGGDQPHAGASRSNNNPVVAGQDQLNKIPGSSATSNEQLSTEKRIGQNSGQPTNTVISSQPPANRAPSKGKSQKQTLTGILVSGNKSSVNQTVMPQQTAGTNLVVMNDPEASLAGMVTARALPEINKPAIDRNNIGIRDVPAATTGKKSPKQTTSKFPFSVSLMGGADWTTVKFTHKEQAGYNAGLTFTWHFAKNFSVTTGAVYMKKNYSADGKDYHPPKGYWTNYITLDEVNGSCWMIDIPLNLRYDFATGKKSSFFGSAGASTYLMDKESYTYHYWNNGNYYKRHWENNDNSNHVFSILNLSAGYEKTVTKNISAQIEPYIKLPMAGIGFGNMQMSSYGLNFAIRYHPQFKKQNITVPVNNP